LTTRIYNFGLVLELEKSGINGVSRCTPCQRT
jgi:hypothetical protein